MTAACISSPPPFMYLAMSVMLCGAQASRHYLNVVISCMYAVVIALLERKHVALRGYCCNGAPLLARTAAHKQSD